MGSTWKALPWVMRWSNPGEPLLPRFFASQTRVARIVWCWDGNNNLILVRVADILSTHTSLQYPLRCCINQSSNLLRGKSSTHVHDQPTTTESMFIPKAIGFKLVAIYYIWLVVDLPILKNMSSSMGRMTSHIFMENIKCSKPPTSHRYLDVPREPTQK